MDFRDLEFRKILEFVDLVLRGSKGECLSVEGEEQKKKLNNLNIEFEEY